MSRLARDQQSLMARRSAAKVDSEAAAEAVAAPPARRERPAYLRYGAALVAIAVLFAGAAYVFLGHDDLPPPRQVRELTIVNVIPPPPPPPPPPRPPEQKMIEQPKEAEQKLPEDKPLEKPKDEPIKDAKNEEPPGPLSLDAKAVGPGDLFNLGGKPGGNPYGGGGGGGSRWGWYASIVTSQMQTVLNANPKTRFAAMRVQIRLWADSSGHVSKVQLVSSTGDAEIDAAIRNEVFANMTLREPPPKDMPMPIVTMVTARRSS